MRIRAGDTLSLRATALFDIGADISDDDYVGVRIGPSQSSSYVPAAAIQDVKEQFLRGDTVCIADSDFAEIGEPAMLVVSVDGDEVWCRDEDGDSQVYKAADLRRTEKPEPSPDAVAAENGGGLIVEHLGKGQVA